MWLNNMVLTKNQHYPMTDNTTSGYKVSFCADQFLKIRKTVPLSTTVSHAQGCTVFFTTALRLASKLQTELLSFENFRPKWE